MEDGLKNVIHECDEYIEFDMLKIQELDTYYKETMKHLADNLPSINLNSPASVIDFFHKTFKINLTSSKIAEVSQYINMYGDDSDEKELIQGIVYYFKIKYAHRNYIKNILMHQNNGRVQLRWYFGELRFPNKRPLPYSLEILNAIIGGSDVAMRMVKHNLERNIYG